MVGHRVEVGRGVKLGRGGDGEVVGLGRGVGRREPSDRTAAGRLSC